MLTYPVQHKLLVRCEAGTTCDLFVSLLVHMIAKKREVLVDFNIAGFGILFKPRRWNSHRQLVCSDFLQINGQKKLPNKGVNQKLQR